MSDHSVTVQVRSQTNSVNIFSIKTQLKLKLKLDTSELPGVEVVTLFTVKGDFYRRW